MKEGYTRETFPQEWAMSHNNLGIIYKERIKGQKAENLELAITAFHESLKVYSSQAFPYEWAITQMNLGNAYGHRIRGEKGENIELAITAHNRALDIFTPEAFPEHYAMTQMNLGSACLDRIKGEKKENLELAIAALKQSLEVYTREAFPEQWAMSQVNLGIAYLRRIKGEKKENLELAIAALNQSLEVYTRKAFPEDWAMTQMNLGSAYLDRVKGEKKENLELAITAYQECLEVFTPNTFPERWVMSHNNLGAAYRETNQIFKSIESIRLSLTICNPSDFPTKCLQTGYNLAISANRIEDWNTTIEGSKVAIEAVENSRLEALNPQSRQEVLSNAIRVFHGIVQAYLNLNQPEKALEYIERSKGRNLVELMTQKALKPQGIDQEVIDKLAELKQQVINEQIRLQHQSINKNLMRSDKLTPHVQDHSYLKEYQQKLDTFIAEEITPYDPIFTLTQKVQPIPFEDIKSLTDDSTCLLQWYITSEKILAFIVSADEDVKVWQSSEEDRKQLIDALNNYRQLYYSDNGKKEWINQLPNLLQTFANVLHINEIISIIPETCQRLIIIPYWFLHILPLHALPIDNNCILQDTYNIQYAPSCQLLQITKQRPLNQLTNLFAIQNPTTDLIFTDLEVNIISTLFNQKEIIAKDDAIENTVTKQIKASESHCYHFSCHGSFNSNNPLNSALLLANEDKLTLGKIFDIDLKKARLVVLSACETGLIDLNSISDEYIGLPAGFLFAGSSSVVSSLWTVSDLSTSFLIIKFYEIVLDKPQNIPIPVALKMAQNWLKTLTIQEFDNLLIKYETEINQIKKISSGKRLIIEKQIELTRKRGEYPFANPYYWSAFFASGV